MLIHMASVVVVVVVCGGGGGVVAVAAIGVVVVVKITHISRRYGLVEAKQHLCIAYA